MTYISVHKTITLLLYVKQVQETKSEPNKELANQFKQAVQAKLTGEPAVVNGVTSDTPSAESTTKPEQQKSAPAADATPAQKTADTDKVCFSYSMGRMFIGKGIIRR